jgi:hypothetical protein
MKRGLGPLGLLRHSKKKTQGRLEEAIISADVSTRFKLIGYAIFNKYR